MYFLLCRLKLLFVLAHDNLELLAQFSNESQSKLQEKIDRKYTLYGGMRLAFVASFAELSTIFRVGE